MLGIKHFHCQTGNSQALSPIVLLLSVQFRATTSLITVSLGRKSAERDFLIIYSQPSNILGQLPQDYPIGSGQPPLHQVKFCQAPVHFRHEFWTSRSTIVAAGRCFSYHLPARQATGMFCTKLPMTILPVGWRDSEKFSRFDRSYAKETIWAHFPC